MSLTRRAGSRDPKARASREWGLREEGEELGRGLAQLVIRHLPLPHVPRPLAPSRGSYGTAVMHVLNLFKVGQQVAGLLKGAQSDVNIRRISQQYDHTPQASRVQGIVQTVTGTVATVHTLYVVSGYAWHFFQTLAAALGAATTSALAALSDHFLGPFMANQPGDVSDSISSLYQGNRNLRELSLVNTVLRSLLVTVRVPVGKLRFTTTNDYVAPSNQKIYIGVRSVMMVTLLDQFGFVVAHEGMTFLGFDTGRWQIATTSASSNLISAMKWVEAGGWVGNGMTVTGASAGSPEDEMTVVVSSTALAEWMSYGAVTVAVTVFQQNWASTDGVVTPSAGALWCEIDPPQAFEVPCHSQVSEPVDLCLSNSTVGELVVSIGQVGVAVNDEPPVWEPDTEGLPAGCYIVPVDE